MSVEIMQSELIRSGQSADKLYDFAHVDVFGQNFGIYPLAFVGEMRVDVVSVNDMSLEDIRRCRSRSCSWCDYNANRFRDGATNGSEPTALPSECEAWCSLCVDEGSLQRLTVRVPGRRSVRKPR